MSALDRTPNNTNFLQADGFQIIIKKCPTVTFFCQELVIPGFMNPAPEQPNPNIRIPHTGDHIIYDDLQIEFKLDEDLKNYLEIYNWINGTGYPDDHSQYKELADKPRYTNEGIYSDISIILTTNIKNYNVEFLFRDAFPVGLSGFSLSTTSQGVQFLSTTATFKYIKYDITSLPK